jgi:hypothetical protein
MKFLSLLIFAAVIGFAMSCAEHHIPAAECTSGTTISYVNDVKSIVANKCATTGCHNGSNGSDINWLEFNNFQSHKVEVRRRITLAPSETDHMPRKGSLTADELQKIICWIDQGALDN